MFAFNAPDVTFDTLSMFDAAAVLVSFGCHLVHIILKHQQAKPTKWKTNSKVIVVSTRYF